MLRWLRRLLCRRPSPDVVVRSLPAAASRPGRRRISTTAGEFEAVRGYLVKNAPIAVAQSAAQAGAALDAQWFGVAPWPRYVREGLARLTVEDVNRAMRAHLSATDVVIVAVAKDARGLAAALVADAPSRPAYDSEKPKAVLDEDAIIGAEKLGLQAGAVTVIPVEAVFAR